MKKNYLFSVILTLCTFYISLSQSVIISQYIETDSGTTPKGIEIFNVSGADITFSVANNLEVLQGTNGGSCNSLVNIQSGTLVANEVWVIGTSNLTTYAIANGTNLSGTTDQTFLFNGDDALEIRLGGVTQDMFGVCGSDPGSSWNSGGVDTRNNNLQIKNGICLGDTDGWTDPSVRFDEIAVGTVMTGFGDAPAPCSSTDTFVGFASVTSSVNENGTSIDVCVSIVNPSPTVDTTVDVTLNGTSTAINGTDYDDSGSAFSFPVTLTFPANSGADECITFAIIDDLIFEGDETVVINLTNPNGGINAGLGLNTEHTLTILEDETPVIADVVITEIMYNSLGVDDEWIEICNTTGITQVLSDYAIHVDNSLIPDFTFPLTGITLDPGDCITVSLGDGGGAYNPGCNFTPDYTTGPGTGALDNSSGTIEIIAPDGTTVVDVVDYDDGDGADGTGASLHVTDDSLDNSDTGTNWQEVIDGGSPGFNTLISQCSTPEPEINVEGNINSYNDIPDGLINTPNSFDNTLFSTIPLAASEARTFRIQNIGTVDLNVSNIEIFGADAGDFAITSPAVLSFTVGNISTANNVEIFEVTFTPTAAGERNAFVRITNDDSADGEGEEIFEFNIRGNAYCTGASNVLTPLTGPDFTVVTITGSDLDGGTTVEFGGSIIPHTSISPTEIEFTIPANATTGAIVVTNNLGCQTTDLFTVIDNAISSCEGSSGLSPTDLFISEITDAPSGSHTYIEIYNGTGAPVDLEHYEIRVHNNGSNNAGGDIADLSGILADATAYVIAIGGTNVNDPEGGYTADDFFAISGINNNDNIRLYFDDGVVENWIDVWGDINGNNFTIAAAGYTYRRLNTGITVPRTDGWNGPAASDDMMNDWGAIAPVNYDDIGIFDFSTGAPPTITTQPSASVSTCDATASFIVAASEGFPGGTYGLEFEWFVSAPGDSGWTDLSDNAIYSGTSSNNLVISNTIGLDNYQYYCQVREDTNSCFTASNAVRLITQSTRWVGPAPGSWTNGAPDINTIAEIDFDYTTGDVGAGSFSACQLIVNSGATLIIDNSDYVQVDTDVSVDGTVIVRSYGSFVQVDDLGSVTVSAPNNITVEKTTAVLNSYQEYTYWSAPVSGETIANGLNESDPNRRFLFNAQNYRDSQMENMNDNATDPGQDDIDDNGDDWQYVAGGTVMEPGVGYAATHAPAGYIGPGNQYLFTFEGPFNNGVYNVPVYRNDAETSDNNWNFIGNPYPSAISADDFFTQNRYDVSTNPTGALEGAIYLWSHNTAADGNTNGNEALNYSTSDYAIINGTGESLGGDNVTPNRFIPSGQGFFVVMSDDVVDTPVTATVGRADVVFNNSMRSLGDNDQFFRTTYAPSENKFKLNLTSDNGVFSQILVGYVNGASDVFDGLYYDAPRNLSIGASSILYSIIENSDKRFAIQGKAATSLDLDEVVPLGFYTSIPEATLYTIAIAEIEGEFLSEHSIFIKDKLLNMTHNLSESDYTFTSEVGDFTNRFDVVFQPDTLSTTDNVFTSDSLTIVELNDGRVKFSVPSNVTIENIQIIDLLGRTLYNVDLSQSVEILELNGLSQSAYLAKVRLSNGTTLTKRAIKRH